MPSLSQFLSHHICKEFAGREGKKKERKKKSSGCRLSPYSADNKLTLECKNKHGLILCQASALVNELLEESDQFRFLLVVCLTNLKGSVGLNVVKTSDMRISIPLDLSSRSFIPLSRFIRSHRPTPFLDPSLVLFPPCSDSTAHVGCFF